MDPQSPPKRVTRARAAAKAVESASKTTKIMTAAARAKTARGTLTTSSASTLNTTTSRGSLKRKSPFDDEEEEESDHEEQKPTKPSSSLAVKPTRGRGRPKKATEAPSAPVLSTSTRARGRPRKTVETIASETAARTAQPRKTATEPEPAAAKKPTTRRPATAATASTAAKSLAKPVIKKTVKFEVPEKENVAPPSRSSTQAASTTGALNKKPVRKGATATGRTARATKGATNAVSNTVSSTKDKPLPLSPKKINQLAVSRAAESDDELGMDEKVPVRRFKKAPVKPAMGATKALASSVDRRHPTENDENVPVMPTSDATLTLMLGTPAKRLPPSPWKGSMKSPPRRVDGLFAASTSQAQPEGQVSPIKCSLLQTPAKRQPLAIPIALGSVGGSQVNPSPFKFSLLSSPAKRSVVSPIKSFPPRIEEEEEECKSPAPKPTLLASPMPAVPVPAEQEARTLSDEDGDMIMGNTDEEEEDDVAVVSPEVPEFPGRLSTILPRHADPVLALETSLSEEEEEEKQEQEEVHIDDVVENNENKVDDEIEEQVEQVEQEEQEQEEEGEEEEEVELIEQENDKAAAEEDSAETFLQENEQVEEQCEEMAVDSADAEEPEEQARPAPKVAPALFQFGLRTKDLDPYQSEDTDSEDEAPTRQNPFSSAFTALPNTPCRRSSLRTPRAQTSQPRMSSGRSTAKRVRIDDSVGFTPLASQLNGWTAGPSPVKTNSKADSPLSVSHETDEEENTSTNEDLATPGLEPENGFFENEMLNRSDAMDVDEEAVDSSAEIETPILEDITPTEEDAALAAEANEMSLMEPEQAEANMSNSSHDDTISEASQEYGDENELPVDPNISSRATTTASPVPPVTPARTLRPREVHTVAKVPLKPADDSTPRPKPIQRAGSASRLPVSRPTDRVTRSATVISYTPTKTESVEEMEDEEEAQAKSVPPVTPAKGDIWSTLGTPARTPRRDLNPALLRGAVVFVDVHTTEGADASGIFVELLTQMGARCLKEWKWNPTNTDSKIGITHVVYKDGGKRTLEKVRQSEGVVQCVGVSWVLDCERENEWLEEGPYAIDTQIIPRGGARRRKSMEPRAMSNMNGTLIPAPVKGSTSSNSTPTNSSTTRTGNQTAPTTPASNRSSSRRASSLWVRTPEEPRISVDDIDSEDDREHKEDDDDTWGVVLTPVPKTPAPEAIARYVANISPGSDMSSVAGDDDEDEERKSQEMLTRTCPPKRATFIELGERVLNKEKDERVLMRLMAARRKSLQFAPKIGSPLAKSWR
ncbi:uncharacterized protein PODANS_1_3200 [Podospora anserina S mat+]|uniref:Podospora anserina S mat+ genomic DNA chromosome 1, supercontig 1 n=1 Tax=Podospora anserina (strain S / ATCC MYA-4624 / DSM 980 / FGSC 10383) TaxID=515849 RepID=B2AA86_PODAN|nr:uncharacterized protein PODANS_1_3200 [Podospora anserina S mat+]CAP59998.1 unnamed protein product [Podospora anserina S mat+]CDP22639.1 Putative protein of unknown function [Podospora anserina S mat+]